MQLPHSIVDDTRGKVGVGQRMSMLGSSWRGGPCMLLPSRLSLPAGLSMSLHSFLLACGRN